MLKKKKFLIGGIVIIIAISFLAITGFLDANRYYYTVSEAAALGSEVYERDVKVNGFVVPDSVESDVTALTLKFTIAQGGSQMPVVFHGAMPDNFQPDAEVVVEGRVDRSGVLQAETILTKCPSKYVPEE